MLSGSVKGRAELAKIQANVSAAPKTMHAQMLAGTRKAMTPFRPDVVGETKTLPKRGGYAAIMAAAAVVTTRVTSSGGRINASAKVAAKGKGEPRDVAAVNRGRLRHPNANRTRWWTTATRPGFVTRPQDRLVDRIGDEVRSAMNNTADTIVRG